MEGNQALESGADAIKSALIRVGEPVYVLNLNDRIAVGRGGWAVLGNSLPDGSNGFPLWGYAPGLHPQNLGDAVLKKLLNIRYAYIVGAMANGITSVEMVEKAGRAGMLAFFGAAGLELGAIDAAIATLKQRLFDLPYGFNLIHSPNDPELENAVVNLYLERGVNLISASAFLDLTLPLVLFRVKGIHQDSQGRIVCPHRLVAKVSRIEVARKFFSPPPPKLLSRLLAQNLISTAEASLAQHIPMADALTAEADSGGHTDNRPALALLPTMIALRDQMQTQYGYQISPAVGLGGGIATPQATAAAFAMDAAYVLAGSVHQACIESGTSDTVRKMLAETRQADVSMAPAADMFEMGVKVQVLKRGTMFPLRAAKLYELYNAYAGLDEIPEKERLGLERDILRCRFEEEWEQTKSFFMQRDPNQVVRAETDPKHKMALIFRSYLGRSSTWANIGDPDRKIDYQIWCGPAMGAFNEWARGSVLERPENRKTITVAMNLLLGACVVTRAGWLRSQGVPLPSSVSQFSPRPLAEIAEILNEPSLKLIT